MNRKRQRQLEAAYIKDWNPDKKDALSILQECALHMLENSNKKIEQLMDYHKRSFYQTFAMNQLPIYPFTCRFIFHPSLTYEGVYLKKGTILYLQGNDLYTMRLQEELMVQDAVVNSIVYYHPDEQYLQIQDISQEEDMLFHNINNNHQHFSYSFLFENCFMNMKHPKFQLCILGRNEQETNEITKFLSNQKAYWEVYVNDELVDFKINAQTESFEVQLNYIFSLEDHLVRFELKSDCVQKVPHIILQEIYIKYIDQTCFLTKVVQDEVELNTSSFLLFDKPMSLFQTTYLRCDEAFARKGSFITWKFQMETSTFKVMPELIEEVSYHLFMRKLPKDQIVYDVFADRIQLEYFNGEWTTLPKTSKYASFAKENHDFMSIQFQCPNDILPYTVAGEYTYWIRLTLVKAENCYQVPAIHHIPELMKHRLHYHFENHKIQPTNVIGYANNEQIDMRKRWEETGEYHLFEKRNEQQPCVFFHFTKQPKGLLRMYIECKNTYEQANPMKAYTYVNNVEMPIEFEDTTNGFAHSGNITIYITEELSNQQEFGREGYWIKFYLKEDQIQTQSITNILFNSALATFDGTTTDTFVLDINQLPFLYDVPIDSHILSVKVKEVRDKKTQWVPWQISKVVTQQKREVLLQNDQLIFTYANVDHIPILKDQENVKVTYQNFVEEQSITKDTIVFMGKGYPEIAFVKVYENQMIGLEKEDDLHFSHRIKHWLRHKDAWISLQDIEQHLVDLFCDILKIKAIFEKPKDAQTYVLIIAIQWKKKQDVNVKNHEIKDLVVQNTPQTKNLTIQIMEPIEIEVEVYLQIRNTIESIVSIKRQIASFFHPEYGGLNQQGWKIGQFVSDDSFMEYLHNQFPLLDVIQCRLYGKTRLQNQLIYQPFSMFHQMKWGMMRDGKVEMEVVHDE